MRKRYYDDSQDDKDDTTYDMLGSRYTGVATDHVGKLQRKRRQWSDDFENSQWRREARKAWETLN